MCVCVCTGVSACVCTCWASLDRKASLSRSTAAEGSMNLRDEPSRRANRQRSSCMKATFLLSCHTHTSDDYTHTLIPTSPVWHLLSGSCICPAGVPSGSSSEPAGGTLGGGTGTETQTHLGYGGLGNCSLGYCGLGYCGHDALRTDKDHIYRLLQSHLQTIETYSPTNTKDDIIFHVPQEMK